MHSNLGRLAKTGGTQGILVLAENTHGGRIGASTPTLPTVLVLKFTSSIGMVFFAAKQHTLFLINASGL